MTLQQNDRVKQLLSDIKSRILIIDGAMGTALQDKNLSVSDFGGALYEGCNENLVLTRPEIIKEIHETYLKAGADIIETNTFGGTPFVLDEFQLGHRTYDINFQAAQIARKACENFSHNGKIKYVAGSIGPTTKALSVTGGITFAELTENFYQQARALFEGGVDYFLLETCQDTRNIKSCLCALDRLFQEKNTQIPIAISGTIEPMGTMLAGQSIEALVASMMHKELLYLGLNCATGPEFMTDHIRTLADISPFCVSCVPNAGLPDHNGQYLESPEMVAKVISRFIEKKWVNVIGGCCGTTPHHIQKLAQIAENAEKHIPQKINKSFLSGIDFLEVTQEMRPIIVGERTNVIGSRKFKNLICAEKYDEASDIARAQIKNGAQIIDVCLANPDRDELSDTKKFLELAVKKIKAPLMIDSTDALVIEEALTYSQGKAIINSINLEDGEERFEKVVPLGLKFGAAFVVGTIDEDPEQGMGVTRQRKLEIAERSYELLTQKYGVAPEDIYWDPLVFPCATGDKQYVGSAVETIEGVRLIKARFPETKTVLGISNVSFGLPEAGREVLNSVFLYHCVQAGLDLAIVNAEKLERFSSIPKEEIALAENLLYNKGKDPITDFANFFRTKKVIEKKEKSLFTLEERLANYIIEGSKDGLIQDLDLILQNTRPLDIINGPLMKGMDEVGRLFNKNELIVAEVLQSAEAMKAAVAHLEPFMEKNESSNRGKIILATVKGDVHDIGKNLVDIILSNNGFQVINLGIKVLPETLIQSIREHNPDIVGLSGLLVKSAQQMTVTAEDFSKAGISTPILVGGAALTETFVDQKIAPVYPTGTVLYAKDAMHGLELSKSIVDPEKFNALRLNTNQKREEKKKNAQPAPAQRIFTPISEVRCKNLKWIEMPPEPQDYKRHILTNTPIDHIWKFINPLMLYGRHLGIKGGIVRLLEKAHTDPLTKKTLQESDPRSLEVWNAVEEVKNEYRDTEIMHPSAVFQFFKAYSEGNSIFILDENKNAHTLEFPRQKKPEGEGLCLSDYLNTKDKNQDNLAFFAVSIGKGLRELAENLKNKGDYLKSHVVQALALESAEAYAELLHSQIRKTWGFPDDPQMTMMQRFQAKYIGKRYSFGYPACPSLEDQKILFSLIQPEDIGIQLTDGFMMDPEASVSAIVFHHPEAQYFSVGSQHEENRI